MSCSSIKLAVALGIFFSLSLPSVVAAQQAPAVEEYLTSGKLAQAENALKDHLQRHADDQQTIFELGVVQFLRAVEELSQNLYRYGARPQFGSGQIPFLANPTATNPNPQKINYEASRAIVQKWVDDLGTAEATLDLVQVEHVH